MRTIKEPTRNPVFRGTCNACLAILEATLIELDNVVFRSVGEFSALEADGSICENRIRRGHGTAACLYCGNMMDFHQNIDDDWEEWINNE